MARAGGRRPTNAVTLLGGALPCVTSAFVKNREAAVPTEAFANGIKLWVGGARALFTRYCAAASIDFACRRTSLSSGTVQNVAMPAAAQPAATTNEVI